MGNSYAKEEAPPSPPKASARTKIEMQSFEFTWTIEHFPVWVNCMAKEMEDSPPFTTGEHTWCLQFNPKDTHEGDDYISLLLKAVRSLKPEVCARFKIGILCGIRVHWADDGELEHSFDFEKKESWGYNRYIPKACLLTKCYDYLSPNDTITIACEVTIFSLSETSPQVILPECHLKSLSTFLQSLPSDVTLVVGKEEFPAHKSILASASPVFLAMFEHEMKEKLENRVEIEGIDSSVFKEFLHFIKTGKVNNLEKNAEAFLIVSERYGVERLKAICEEFFASQLSVKNVVDVHCFACRHNATQLKAITSGFLKKHSTEIAQSGSFQSLMDVAQQM